MSFPRPCMYRIYGKGWSFWPPNWSSIMLGVSPYVEYALFTDTFTSGSSYLPVLEFYYSYKMAYGVNPTPLAAQAYDAAKALLASRGKEKGLRPLGSVRFLGVTGMVGFDEKGDPLRVPALLMVEGGKIRQIN